MRITALAGIILITALAAQPAHAQTYKVKLQQTVTPGTLTVDIMIGDADPEFVLGTSSFVFNYNASALSTPVKVGANDGPWDIDLDIDYDPMSFQQGVGFAGVTVEFAGSDDGDYSGDFVPTDKSYTRVGTISFTITDPLQSSGLSWRAVGTSTIVYMLTTPGSGTGQTIITSTGTFEAPTDLPLPVELVSFVATASNDPYRVLLTWKTATERENYGFEVQKSENDKSHYVTIPNSFQPGHGTTNVPQSYSYVDVTATPGTFYYRLKQIDLSGKINYYDGILPAQTGTTGVEERALPTAYGLDQNYPNPFNPATTISFALPAAGRVSLDVYNLIGQRVATLVDGQREAGYYSVSFDAATLPSGVYVYKLSAGQASFVKRMILLK